MIFFFQAPPPAQVETLPPIRYLPSAPVDPLDKAAVAAAAKEALREATGPTDPAGKPLRRGLAPNST